MHTRPGPRRLRPRRFGAGYAMAGRLGSLTGERRRSARPSPTSRPGAGRLDSLTLDIGSTSTGFILTGRTRTRGDIGCRETRDVICLVAWVRDASRPTSHGADMPALLSARNLCIDPSSNRPRSGPEIVWSTAVRTGPDADPRTNLRLHRLLGSQCDTRDRPPTSPLLVGSIACSPGCRRNAARPRRSIGVSRRSGLGGGQAGRGGCLRPEVSTTLVSGPSSTGKRGSSDPKGVAVAEPFALASAPDRDPALATDLPGTIRPIAAVPSSRPRTVVPRGALRIIRAANVSGTCRNGERPRCRRRVPGTRGSGAADEAVGGSGPCRSHRTIAPAEQPARTPPRSWTAIAAAQTALPDSARGDSRVAAREVDQIGLGDGLDAGRVVGLRLDRAPGPPRPRRRGAAKCSTPMAAQRWKTVLAVGR